MNIPLGYCQCGCGRKTRIADKTGHHQDWIAGQPVQFLRGHHLKLIPESHRNGINQNIEDKNGMWKGDEVGYTSLHEWIKNRKPKPDLCEYCGKTKPYDLANISGEYKRDVNDYEWICRSCHMKKDGRIKNLLLGHKSRWGD